MNYRDSRLIRICSLLSVIVPYVIHILIVDPAEYGGNHHCEITRSYLRVDETRSHPKDATDLILYFDVVLRP